MSKRTSPEQQQQGANAASQEVSKRRKLVDQIEKMVEKELSKVKEDLIDDVLENLKTYKNDNKKASSSWTKNKTKHIHFVGTWIPPSGGEGKPVHYHYWGWDEERVKSILDVFRRASNGGSMCMLRHFEIESSSSSSSSSSSGSLEEGWTKEVICLTMKGIWSLFLECMLDACNEDRRMDIPKERMLLFKRLFKFDCREDLELKKVGELEDLRTYYHYSRPYAYDSPSYIVYLGIIRAKDPEYLTFNQAVLDKKKERSERENNRPDDSDDDDDRDEILDGCKVYPNDPKDICPSCNEACEAHPIAKCPRCRRVARCLEVCHECTLEEEAECLANKKKAESIAASTLVEIANDDDDSDDNDEGEELQ